MRFFLLLLSGLLTPVFVHATHVIGGTIMYEHLGNDSYAISVRLYRDCSPSTTPFPNSVAVQVKDVNGNNLVPSENFTSSLDSVLPVPSYLSPCVVNPGICIEEGFYTSIVTLPPVTGGYHVYHQYCCRNSLFSNIINPISMGESLYTFIPDESTTGANNSAHWNLQPPLFECQGNPMLYDNGATDADGDSLVFSYYTPYTDANPTFPSGVATFTPVPWAGGYSANNPCGGPNLTMNAQTGFITGAPPNIGWYIAGVRCEEYRNGVKIAEILRDYPFIVVSCNPAPVASFIAPAVTCYQDVVQLQNTSVSASTYHWDFGDPNISNDTSNLPGPSWTYANPGTYTVTLIINPNTACTDTATTVLTVQQVHAAFTANDTLYTLVASQFNDSSWTSNGSPVVWWSWDFGDATPLDNTQNPTHVYSTTGTYTVTLIVLSADGCLDTTAFTVYVDLFNGTQSSNHLPLKVYPNPSDGIFNIVVPHASGTLRLTDLQGREIFRKEINGQTPLTFCFGNTPGIYLLEFTSGDVRLIQKLVVE